MSKNGKLVVAALAGLFAATAPLAAHAGDEKGDKKVHCTGINSCKGTGSCAGAKNGCAGKNGCKGEGWVEVTEKECKDKGGKVATADDKMKKK